MGIPLKWVSLGFLIPQNVLSVLLVRFSRTSYAAETLYLPSTAVYFAEVLKFLLSVLFLYFEVGSWAALATYLRHNLVGNLRDTLNTVIPSLLYVIQNNLGYISISHLSSGVHQVLLQCKILSTAILSVVILQKVLGPAQWCSLALLTLGVVFVEFPRGDSQGISTGESEGANRHFSSLSRIIGVSANVGASVLSGLAGVYLEKILKTLDISMWMRNLQLSLFGMMLAFFCALVQDGHRIQANGFLQGYNPLVWLVIFAQAMGGVLVAAVMRYADNILKCFATAVSVILTCIFSAFVMEEFEPDLMFVCGVSLVLTSSGLYSIGCPSLLERACSRLTCHCAFVRRAPAPKIRNAVTPRLTIVGHAERSLKTAQRSIHDGVDNSPV